MASRTCKRHPAEVAIRDKVGRELEVAEVCETSAVLYPHRFAAQVIKAFATRHKPLDRQTFQRPDRQQVKNCDSRADEISSFQPLLLGSHDDHYARARHLCLGSCLLRDAPPKILQMPLATRADLRKLQQGKSRVPSTLGRSVWRKWSRKVVPSGSLALPSVGGQPPAYVSVPPPLKQETAKKKEKKRKCETKKTTIIFENENKTIASQCTGKRHRRNQRKEDKVAAR